MKAAGSGATLPVAPPSVVLSATMSSPVPDRAVTMRPLGASAVSQEAGTAGTETVETMRS